jgi:aminoglycoside 3'-phosphotransferase-1
VLQADAEGRAAVVDVLARFLRRLHVVPVQDCPFDAGHFLRLAQARARVEAGRVDVDDFDEKRRGWSPAQVLERAMAGLPPPTDPVVTHGDLSLENILLQADEVTGCIDVGRAGLCDRYQDLAVLWNCVGHFGPPLQQRLFTSYGIPVIDEPRLRFHLLLDELF